MLEQHSFLSNFLCQFWSFLFLAFGWFCKAQTGCSHESHRKLSCLLPSSDGGLFSVEYLITVFSNGKNATSPSSNLWATLLKYWMAQYRREHCVIQFRFSIPWKGPITKELLWYRQILIVHNFILVEFVYMYSFHNASLINGVFRKFTGSS